MEDNKKWKPEMRQIYYYVDFDNASIIDYAEWWGDETDNDRYRNNNIFKNRAEAIDSAINKAKHVLKELDD